MTEEKYTQIKWNCWISARRTSSRSSRKTSTTRSTTSSCTAITAKLELREAHHKSLNEMEELKMFQSSTFDTVARRRLVEDQDTILELTGKIQELQNEINCMSDSRDFQDAESVRSGHSHVTSQPCVFPTSSNSWWNAEPIYRTAEPQRWAAKHLGHTWYIGERFCKSSCVLFRTLSAGIESMEFWKSEKQTPVQHQRYQSGPSAKSSVIPTEGDSLKNYGADQ